MKACDTVAMGNFRLHFPPFISAPFVSDVLAADSVLIVQNGKNLNHLNTTESWTLTSAGLKKAHKESAVYEGVWGK